MNFGELLNELHDVENELYHMNLYAAKMGFGARGEERANSRAMLTRNDILNKAFEDRKSLITEMYSRVEDFLTENTNTSSTNPMHADRKQLRQDILAMEKNIANLNNVIAKHAATGDRPYGRTADRGRELEAAFLTAHRELWTMILNILDNEVQMNLEDLRTLDIAMRRAHTASHTHHRATY